MSYLNGKPWYFVLIWVFYELTLFFTVVFLTYYALGCEDSSFFDIEHIRFFIRSFDFMETLITVWFFIASPVLLLIIFAFLNYIFKHA